MTDESATARSGITDRSKPYVDCYECDQDSWASLSNTPRIRPSWSYRWKYCTRRIYDGWSPDIRGNNPSIGRSHVWFRTNINKDSKGGSSPVSRWTVYLPSLVLA